MALKHQMLLAYPDKVNGTDYFLINYFTGRGAEVQRANFTVDMNLVNSFKAQGDQAEADENNTTIPNVQDQLNSITATLQYLADNGTDIGEAGTALCTKMAPAIQKLGVSLVGATKIAG